MSATVGQAQTLTGVALERTAALKSETEQMRAAMEIALKEQLTATSEMTSAWMNEIADVMTRKMMEMQAQTQVEIDRVHAMELEKVRKELQELRVASGQTITSVKHTSAEEATRVQQDLQALRQELEE